MLEFVDMKVGEFLRALAAPTPTPGGGTAAAIAGAMAASLLGMAASVSLRKKPEDRVLQGTISRAEELREKFLKLAQEDTAAYEKVVAAYKLPRETPEEAEARRAAIQEVLVEAARVPLRTAELSFEVLELAAVARGSIPEAIASDVLVAVRLAHAAVKGALYNVDINCLSLKDEAALAEFAPRREEIEARADEIVTQFAGTEANIKKWLGEEDSNLH